MPEFADQETNDDEDTEAYAQLDELEKLETIIMLMEELNIETLAEARQRFDVLERTIETDA